RIVPMTDTYDVLLDDRTGIQLFGYIVASCTDEFHPPLRCLVIRSCADKGRQETVVDIDYPPGVLLAELSRKNLHITRQYNTVGLLLIHQPGNFIKCRLLVLRIDWNMMKGNIMPFDHAAQIVMIGNHTGYFTIQLTTVEAVQQIRQTMGLAAGHQHHFLALSRITHLPLRLILRGNG